MCWKLFRSVVLPDTAELYVLKGISSCRPTWYPRALCAERYFILLSYPIHQSFMCWRYFIMSSYLIQQSFMCWKVFHPFVLPDTPELYVVCAERYFILSSFTDSHSQELYVLTGKFILSSYIDTPELYVLKGISFCYPTRYTRYPALCADRYFVLSSNQIPIYTTLCADRYFILSSY